MEIVNKFKIYFIIFIISSLLIIDPLINRGIFQAHDMPSNLTYLAAFYESLTEGNIIPRWGGNIANLYGSPTIMFFYPLSYYFSSAIKFFGFSLIDSIKIYLSFSLVFSSLFMFIWLKKHFSSIPALIGALLYVYAPYRITDIYARGSIAENTFFIFLPLICNQMYLLMNAIKIKRLIAFSVILFLSIISHPFMLIVLSPLFLSYFIYLKLSYKFSIIKLKYLLFAVFLGITLSSFYIIPLVYENKYTHYDLSPFNGRDYYKEFLEFKELVIPQWTFIDIYGSKEYQTYQLGLIQIGLISLGLVVMFFLGRKDNTVKKSARLYLIGIILLAFSIYFMLPISDRVYRFLPLLKRIEFPWRFLSLSLVSISIMTSAYTSLVSSRLQKIILILIIISGIFLYVPNSKGHNYKSYTDDYYLYNIKINTDAFATLPRWAAQPDIYPRISSRYSIIEGDADITTLVRTSTKHFYNVESGDEFRMADATFYFPGWNVYLDGNKIPIEFQDPTFRGIITFKVPSGKHFLQVVFESTKVRLLSDIISAATFFILILLFFYAKKIDKAINSHSNI